MSKASSRPVDVLEEQKADVPQTTAERLRELLRLGRSQDRLSSSGEKAYDERRRPSVSRSRQSIQFEQQSKDEDVLGNVNYISPAKIIEIFDGVIFSEDLCRLSEMKTGSPSSFRKVMPKALSKQISQIVEL